MEKTLSNTQFFSEYGIRDEDVEYFNTNCKTEISRITVALHVIEKIVQTALKMHQMREDYGLNHTSLEEEPPYTGNISFRGLKRLVSSLPENITLEQADHHLANSKAIKTALSKHGRRMEEYNGMRYRIEILGDTNPELLERWQTAKLIYKTKKTLEGSDDPVAHIAKVVVDMWNHAQAFAKDNKNAVDTIIDKGLKKYFDEKQAQSILPVAELAEIKSLFGSILGSLDSALDQADKPQTADEIANRVFSFIVDQAKNPKNQELISQFLAPHIQTGFKGMFK